MTVMNWLPLDPEQDPRRPTAHIIVGKGVQIERVAQRRIPVSESLPAQIGLVWIWRQSTPEPEIAHFTPAQFEAFGKGRFQDPYGVNDHEGLSVEYYDDVTHWCEILPPVVEE